MSILPKCHGEARTGVSPNAHETLSAMPFLFRPWPLISLSWAQVTVSSARPCNPAVHRAWCALSRWSTTAALRPIDAHYPASF